MKNLASPLCLALAALALAACSPKASFPEFPDSIQVGERPESIVRGFDGDYFVSVMGKPGPGDATIVRIKDGVVSTFADGMDEPKGLAYDGQFLYATDLQRVWKVDQTGAKTVFAEAASFPVPIRYLNDAVIGPDGKSLYVTDMGAYDKRFGPDGLWPLDSEEGRSIPVVGRVFKISLPDAAIAVAVEPSPLMPCPNGVSFGKDGQMLIGAFFSGNILELRDGQLTVLADGFRGADAVEQDSQGNYYVSSWTAGKAWRIDAKTKEATVLVEGLASAADFLLEEEANRLLLPDMKSGTVHRVDLP